MQSNMNNKESCLNFNTNYQKIDKEKLVEIHNHNIFGNERKNKEELTALMRNSSTPNCNMEQANKTNNIHEFNTIKAKKGKEIEINNQAPIKGNMPHLHMNEMFIKFNKNEPSSLSKFAKYSNSNASNTKCLTRTSKSSCKTLICKEIVNINPSYNKIKDKLVSDSSSKRLFGIKRR